MADAKNMRVDGASTLTQFVGTLMRQRDLLIEAAKRDDEALRILSTLALPEAMARVERRHWAGKIGHGGRKAWTRRDEQQLNQQRGMIGGSDPVCRVARLVGRYRPSNGFAQHDFLFQKAVAESRHDGTAARLVGLLHDAHVAHDRLLEAAFSLSEDSVSQDVFTGAILSLNQAVSDLLPWGKTVEVDSTLSPHEQSVAGLGIKKIKPNPKTVEIIRAIQAGKSNDEITKDFDCSADVVRKVRSNLKAGKYEI